MNESSPFFAVPAAHRTPLPLRLPHPVLGYVAGAGLVGIAFAVRVALEGFLPPGFPYLTFFPAVVLAAFVFGRGPGILAAAAGFFLSWYYFIAPIGSFGLPRGAVIALGLYVFVVGVNIVLIDWMQHANRRLALERESCRKLAANGEVLFRELQHRVGNNLQMVASLLSLQKRKLTEPAARQALDEAAQRVGLIGRIQRQLYDPQGSQIGLGPFLGALLSDIVAASDKPWVESAVKIEGERVLPPEMAIPTALIVAEAISNAIEHGFARQSAGRIDLVVVQEGDQLVIRVANNGVPLPVGFTIEDAQSLGLRLAANLARSQGGSFEMIQQEHTVAQLRLPIAA